MTLSDRTGYQLVSDIRTYVYVRALQGYTGSVLMEFTACYTEHSLFEDRRHQFKVTSAQCVARTVEAYGLVIGH